MYAGRRLWSGARWRIFSTIRVITIPRGCFVPSPTLNGGHDRADPHPRARPVDLTKLPEGCAFSYPAATSCHEICLTEQPSDAAGNDAHMASCWMNVKRLRRCTEGGECVLSEQIEKQDRSRISAGSPGSEAVLSQSTPAGSEYAPLKAVDGVSFTIWRGRNPGPGGRIRLRQDHRWPAAILRLY